MQTTDLRQAIDVWTRANPGVFEVGDEPDGLHLVDVAAGKPLKLVAEAVAHIEARQNWSTGAEYLALQFVDGPPLALAAAGFVFGLDTRNTGALEGAPPNMSFRDYRRLFGHLVHLVREQADPQRRREALDVSLILIASLDGARAVGLPTQAEEADLEPWIRRLEAGA